jgi:hypothetical protein
MRLLFHHQRRHLFLRPHLRRHRLLPLPLLLRLWNLQSR